VQVDTPEKGGRRAAATGEQLAEEEEEEEGEEGGGAQAMPAPLELRLEALALLAVGVAAGAPVPAAQRVTLPAGAVACGQLEVCPGRQATVDAADGAARCRREATSAASTRMPTQVWVREMALPHSTACARNGSLYAPAAHVSVVVQV
jgi:hypothetical protein